MIPQYERCACVDVEFGSYDRQIELRAPDFMKREDGRGICIDVCIALEIQSLWREGIRTTGCCCGHNKIHPSICVIEGDGKRMVEMGYKGYVNDHDAAVFYAKTGLKSIETKKFLVTFHDTFDGSSWVEDFDIFEEADEKAKKFGGTMAMSYVYERQTFGSPKMRSQYGAF